MGIQASGSKGMVQAGLHNRLIAQLAGHGLLGAGDHVLVEDHQSYIGRVHEAELFQKLRTDCGPPRL